MLNLELDQDMTTSYRILGNISPSFRIIDGLIDGLNFGVDNATSARDFQSLPNKEPFREGRLETVNTINKNRLIENYLTYTKTAGIHSVTALVGHSYQKIYLQGRNYSINRFPLNGIDP